MSISLLCATATANPLNKKGSPFNAPLKGRIYPAGHVDWYSFKLTSPGDITLTVLNLPANYRLDLYDAKLKKLASSSISFKRTKKLTKGELVPGIYRVKVSGIGKAHSSRPYTLRCSYTPNNWTIMVYLDGDNDLESSILADLAEMKRVGSTGRVNVVVEIDTITSTAKRYRVQKNKLADRVDIGEVNMGSPSTLKSFITWAKAKYPALNYFLILNDHGSGWMDELRAPSAYPAKSKKRIPLKAICWDDTSGGDCLTVSELGSVLSQTFPASEKLSLLGLDACLMGMVEVDNQVRDYVKYRVASEASEAGAGWPYNAIVWSATTNPAISPASLAKSVVSVFAHYYTFTDPDNKATLSAMDLGNPYAKLNGSISAFADALAAASASGSLKDIKYDAQTSDFFDYYYIDLGDFAQRIQGNVSLPFSLRTSASSLSGSLNEACLKKFSGSACNATGVSVFLPSRSMWDLMKNSYRSYKFSQNHWDEMIQVYSDLCDFNDNVVTSEEAQTGVSMNGSLDEFTDEVDVYRVNLDQRKNLTVSMSGDAGTDFDLFLFGPETSTINNSDQIIAGSATTTYPETLSYSTADIGGDYFIVVYAGQNAKNGNYTLRADVR